MVINKMIAAWDPVGHQDSLLPGLKKTGNRLF